MPRRRRRRRTAQARSVLPRRVLGLPAAGREALPGRRREPRAARVEPPRRPRGRCARRLRRRARPSATRPVALRSCRTTTGTGIRAGAARQTCRPQRTPSRSGARPPGRGRPRGHRCTLPRGRTGPGHGARSRSPTPGTVATPAPSAPRPDAEHDERAGPAIAAGAVVPAPAAPRQVDPRPSAVDRAGADTDRASARRRRPRSPPRRRRAAPGLRAASAIVVATPLPARRHVQYASVPSRSGPRPRLRPPVSAARSRPPSRLRRLPGGPQPRRLGALMATAGAVSAVGLTLQALARRPRPAPERQRPPSRSRSAPRAQIATRRASPSTTRGSTCSCTRSSRTASSRTRRSPATATRRRTATRRSASTCTSC